MRITILAMALGVVLAAERPGFAQSPDDATVRPTPRRVVRERPRIEVPSGRLLYRECVDGYRLVPRPYWGETVIMPYMHCRWVRG